MKLWIYWMKLWIYWMKLWIYWMKLWIYWMKLDWRQTSRKYLRPSCLGCGYCSEKRMTMSQSARNIVGWILKNDDTINTLANACMGQNPALSLDSFFNITVDGVLSNNIFQPQEITGKVWEYIFFGNLCICFHTVMPERRRWPVWIAFILIQLLH